MQEQFKLDPFTRSLFLFCGRRRDCIKALLWEEDGFLLLYKRLENGRFNWPNSEEQVRSITRRQLEWLLEGLSIDQKNVIKPAFPQKCI